MRVYESILLLLSVVAKNGAEAYCGCDSCNEDVWNAPATDDDGSYTCGARISWLKTTMGMSETDACSKVSDEFSDGPCGPACDPSRCQSSGKTYCGCDSCNQAVWDAMATDSGGSYTCGARISWLQTAMGMSENDACSTVSDEFIDGPCGPACDPTKCQPTGKTYCGCSGCNQAVWDTLATDSGGSYTCGARINWLQTAMNYNLADACAKVGSEFIDGPCGVCACGSPPTPTPPSPPPPTPTAGVVKVMSYNTEYTGYRDGRLNNFASE